MNFFFVVFILVSFSLYGQSTSQDIFKNYQGWQVVQKEAKEKNKYIFLDCYVTWCAPCKQMDSIVYNNKRVLNSLAAHFTCAKVQMDTSKNDDSFVMSWYRESNEIKRTYDVKVFPSFLFFTPEGKIVHRDIGFKDAADFLEVITNASRIRTSSTIPC